MPFVNRTGDAGNDYLADGLTENLIRQFSEVARLKVIARSAVDRVSGKSGVHAPARQPVFRQRGRAWASGGSSSGGICAGLRDAVGTVFPATMSRLLHVPLGLSLNLSPTRFTP